eukprot:SAG31_NODE_10603_length_1118_cov_1.297350_1_plen_173_part_10
MVILQGTTGEWPALTIDERLALARAWREAVPIQSSLKLILHVGHDSIVESRRLAQAAVALQMDAVLISAPSKYIAPTMEAQAEAVVDTLSQCGDIPGFYYHYPEVYNDHFELLPLLRRIGKRAEEEGLDPKRILGAKISIPLDAAACTVRDFEAAPENWVLTTGALDPELWSM